MKTKKDNLITFRLTDELKKKLTEKTIKETVLRKEVIKISDIIREILEKGVK